MPILYILFSLCTTPSGGFCSHADPIAHNPKTMTQADCLSSLSALAKAYPDFTFFCEREQPQP